MPRTPRHNRWVTPILVVLLVGLFAFSFLMAPRPTAADAEAFAGTDATVTAMLESEHGVDPWFAPLFEPGSGEVESGLFALQAALGAGVLGYALGHLRRRRARHDAPEGSRTDA